MSTKKADRCMLRLPPPCEIGEFTMPLKGEELDQQLKDFKTLCEEHEKHIYRRCRRRYYRFGLIASINDETTDYELELLLKHNARTFLVDMVVLRDRELSALLERLKTAVECAQINQVKYNCLVTGIAVQIHGEGCRMGRLRNAKSFLLHFNDIVVLTTNKLYRYSCVKEICYVLNLKFYLNKLKLYDELRLGRCIRGKIVKILRDNVSMLVICGGHVHSYEYFELPDQCAIVDDEVVEEMFMDDLVVAQNIGAHFVVVPQIRCLKFTRALRNYMAKNDINLHIIGSLDVEYVQRNKKLNEMVSLLSLLDFLWLPQMFLCMTACMYTYIKEDIINRARCLNLPIIGLVPLERCCDFKRFESHELLWKLDAFMIEKSPWCQKYPLIVNKLLPIKNFRLAMVENALTIKRLIATYPSIVNFIIRTISTIECQAILVHSKCPEIGNALARMEIYCPVYVVLGIDENLDNQACIEGLARNYNLRRNLHALVYTTDMNECKETPLDYGMSILRRAGVLQAGDFIMTLELFEEVGSQLKVATGKDFIILRAFYLPPSRIANKFRYA